MGLSRILGLLISGMLSPIIEDNLTQLIALTGPAGVWRKTVIDKAVAWAAHFMINALTSGSELASAGHRSTGTPLLEILSFNNT